MKQSLWINELDTAKKTRVQRILHIVHEIKKSVISDIHGIVEKIKETCVVKGDVGEKLKINS